jgi:hypothetical protein
MGGQGRERNGHSEEIRITTMTATKRRRGDKADSEEIMRRREGDSEETITRLEMRIMQREGAGGRVVMGGIRRNKTGGEGK